MDSTKPIAAATAIFLVFFGRTACSQPTTPERARGRLLQLSCYREADEVRRQFGTVVFDTVVPRNVKLSEAPSYGTPIAYYEEHSTGAQAYESLGREVIRRWLSARP